MTKSKAQVIYTELKKINPNAKCELIYHNLFELIIAVVLSAQTTDVSVNKVTPQLFSKYPNPELLSNADLLDVKQIIRNIGLANNKAKNIIELSRIIDKDFNGEVPNDFNKLILLPGVGRKTANVVLSEGFRIPRIAVDTHVFRVSNRLGLSDGKDVLTVEKDLMKLFDESDYHQIHHQLLFFGRYFCKAKNPHCFECPFIEICKNPK